MRGKFKTIINKNFPNSLIVKSSGIDFTERILNGNFRATAGWTLESPLEINTALGMLSSATHINNKRASQTVQLIQGVRYKLSWYNGVITAMTVTPSCGTWTGTPETTAGIKTQYFVATGNSVIFSFLINVPDLFWDNIQSVSLIASP